MVVIKDISFPEFSPTQRVDKALQAYIYDQTNSPYDVILGLDVLKPLGIDISWELTFHVQLKPLPGITPEFLGRQNLIWMMPL